MINLDRVLLCHLISQMKTSSTRNGVVTLCSNSPHIKMNSVQQMLSWMRNSSQGLFGKISLRLPLRSVWIRMERRSRWSCRWRSLVQRGGLRSVCIKGSLTTVNLIIIWKRMLRYRSLPIKNHMRLTILRSHSNHSSSIELICGRYSRKCCRIGQSRQCKCSKIIQESEASISSNNPLLFQIWRKCTEDHQ